MKVRDSGMPDSATWEQFFDAPLVLRRVGFDDRRADVVDFGCGYGTFSIAAAQMTAGTVYAIDMDPGMVAATAARAASLGLGNVRTVERDFDADGTGLPDRSVRFAMLFNLLHTEAPLRMLREARRVLAPGGKLAIIHWVHDAATPRGPELGIRPSPEQCRGWLGQVGFAILVPFIALPPYHFGLTGTLPYHGLPPASAANN